MIDPATGPFLFDTSAESWLARSSDPGLRRWLDVYLSHHPLLISTITVAERIRGYSLLVRKADPENRRRIESARIAYMRQLRRTVPFDEAAALIAGEILALLPEPPTPPRRTHRLAESRQDRLARWRFDGLIAATAIAAGIPLLHNNAVDFEAIEVAMKRSPERFPGIESLRLIGCSLICG